MDVESARAGFPVKQKYRDSNEFMNKRKDLYGGNIRNRIRFHQKVIGAVRERVGDEALILLRLGASDFIPGGSTLEDSQLAAEEFEKAGIDILDISGGGLGDITYRAFPIARRIKDILLPSVKR